MASRARKEHGKSSVHTCAALPGKSGAQAAAGKEPDDGVDDEETDAASTAATLTRAMLIMRVVLLKACMVARTINIDSVLRP